jgi:hypothetical protein
MRAETGKEKGIMTEDERGKERQMHPPVLQAQHLV